MVKIKQNAGGRPRVVPYKSSFNSNNVHPLEAPGDLPVDVETLFTIILVLVDDWYQTEGYRLLKGKRGAKPIFSDSEVLTLLLAMDFFPFPGENQFWALSGPII